MHSKHLLLDRALRSLRTEARREVWVERDLNWAHWLHRVARYPTPVRALAIVSRLGDGLFWYVLIAGLALLGGTNGRDGPPGRGPRSMPWPFSCSRLST